MTTIADAAIADPYAVEAFGGRWGAAWNAHDADAVGALCAEDLVYDEPALGDTVYGREAIHDFVARLGAAFPCNVSGWHRYYTAAELKEMYGNHGRYVSKVTNIIDPLVEHGYVLRDDANAAIRDAAQSDVAK